MRGVLSFSIFISWSTVRRKATVIYCVRNVVAHGDAREEKWRGNWRMEGVTSTLTPLRQVVYPALLTLMRTPQLPAVDWTDSPADLNGLVHLGGRQNVVSARVPSGSVRALTHKRPEYRFYVAHRCHLSGNSKTFQVLFHVLLLC